jgi:hypothetical protein
MDIDIYICTMQRKEEPLKPSQACPGKGGGALGVTVEFFADPACPWCYVARRVLDKALAAVRKSEYEVCVCVCARGVLGGPGECSACLAGGRGPFSLSLRALSPSLPPSLSLSLSLALSLSLSLSLPPSLPLSLPPSLPPALSITYTHTCTRRWR